MAWRESRPNLAKHSSYHNVSKILVVQEPNVSSELSSDLVVRLLFRKYNNPGGRTLSTIHYL